MDRTATTYQCRSWQNISFNPLIQARYLRLTGTYNSTNKVLCGGMGGLWRAAAAGYPDQPNAVTVPEGSTATFQVKLNTAPVNPTTVTVSRVSGDADISVQSGGSLVFNASNWNTNQTVTLAAAEDADMVNSTAVIRCSAPGWASQGRDGDGMG